MLTKPISIIGAARSGTSLLGQLLSQHPDVAFWNEPKYLWRYRKPTVPHDVRTEDEVTAHVRQYIRSRLEEYIQEKKATRLVEKTPSNCFRVPFVHAVLPEARFLHLIRDGRDAAVSAWEQWAILNDAVDDPDEDRSTLRLFKNAWHRIQADDVPVTDLPFYAGKFARSVLRSLGVSEGDTTVNTWGPRFPGIEEKVKSHDLLETCAIQWRESVRAACKGLATVPDEQCLHVRFEDLVRSPAEVIHTILDFTELADCPAMVDYARETVNPDAAYRWKSRETSEIERIMREVGPFIRKVEACDRF